MDYRSLKTNDQLLRAVRAGFVLQGSSLNAWCRANGIVRRTAEQSLSGENKSTNAVALVARIQLAAGLMASNAPRCG
ncbi:MAG: hypothetical protein ABJJ37_05120 [Roseibium sp.]